MALITYREALNQALREELDRDERVFIMGEEVGYFGGAFKVTDGLLAVYGEKRVRDTPIAELTIVGAGVGAAMGGLKPIVELMTINFGLLALDQIVNHAAKIHYMFGGHAKVPLVIRAPQGAGHQLGAQHSQSLEAYFLHCPGLYVAIPATPADAKGLLKSCIRQDNPVIFLEHESLYGVKGEVPDGEHLVPLGKARVAREGKDVTIVSYSKCVYDAMAAAEALENEGIDAEVIDLRTLNPLDITTVIESVKKTGKAMVVYEGWRTGGAGAEIAAQIYEAAFDDLDAPVERVATLDTPIPYNAKLEKAALPSAADIVKVAERMV
ncbi:MAG TPA: alpha-ketoacid dehydrogenase subunit beta [Candidatus Binataceae bacterium]|nr:alpha-ketoacid dehydrogenase subunit beta [Candidatus Binataceae bacterium]HVC43947.1 alpha-ketoacid dehydrogenase subunit beta [Candidatus Binataceae bacterium]